MIVIIIFSIILLLILVGIITFIIKGKEGAAIFSLCIIFIFFGIILYGVVKDYKYGNRSELVTVYKMKHTGSKYNGTYEKDDFVFSYNEQTSNFEDTYKITDIGDYNLKYHKKILSYHFNFPEGTLERIIDNLKEYADYYERDASMTIIINHYKLDIDYYVKSKAIEYNIIKVKSYRIKKVYNKSADKYDNVQVVNNEYLFKYYNPELYIKHINDDYQEFDKELISLIYNKNIDDFVKTINGDEIKYKYLNY